MRRPVPGSSGPPGVRFVSWPSIRVGAMNDLDFYALVTGPVPNPLAEDEEYRDVSPATFNLKVVDLGVLRVPSGHVDAGDPYIGLGEGAVFAVEPGDYPVRVTVADVSDAQDGSHEREAYLSLVLAEGEAASVEAALPIDEPDMPEGEYCHLWVDAGTVAFADHEAVAPSMPGTLVDWYDEVFDTGKPDSWFALMDSPDHYRVGSANIVMPLAGDGENVVLTHSGWGDGAYPVLLTRDADGNPLGLHIDLAVVGSFGEEDDEENDQDDEAVTA